MPSHDHRIEALFARPDDHDRVFEAPGSTIHRKISLTEKPTLALWKDAWTATVAPGAVIDDMPEGWPMKLDVEWRPSTLVYFANSWATPRSISCCWWARRAARATKSRTCTCSSA